MGKLRCPICRSSQWRKEPSSGMLICSEGHILQGYRKETIEQTESSQHVMRKRTMKKTRQEAKVKGHSNLAHYHGSRARFLYLQSLQLLLRLQIASLRELWSLPQEFESICKDVWTLHLSLLPNPIEADVLDESTTIREPPRDETVHEKVPEEDKDSSDSESSLHSSDEEKDEVDLDPEGDLVKLLEGISESSSDSDEPRSENVVATRRKTMRQRDAANLMANVAVLMISCWILRIPVIYMDFVRQIRLYKLPYLDPIRRGLIPQSMTTHMKKDVISSLSPLRPPRPLQLHRITSRLAQGITGKYRITIPEANAPHIVTRALDALHLSASFYPLTKAMASKVSISLNLNPFTGENLSGPRRRHGKNQIGDNIPVEMAFVCVIVLLLKLIYGLDGRPRAQFSEEDLFLNLPKKKEFLPQLRRDTERAEFIEGRTVMDFSEKDLDEYLAFAERALLGDNAEGIQADGERSLDVPISDDTVTPDSEHDEIVTSANDKVEPIPRGKQHTIYCTNDILGLLPAEYQLVVSQAARWCGVEDNDIATVVERYERRLLRDMERGKKAKSRERSEAED